MPNHARRRRECLRIWSVGDAERLAASGFAARVVRVLVEIVHPVDDPAAEAMTIDERLDRLGIATPRLHHGEQDATWPNGIKLMWGLTSARRRSWSAASAGQSGRACGSCTGLRAVWSCARSGGRAAAGRGC